ncbi:Lipopolysaccharide export system permease protein LptG [Serratia symbiotica]|nr:Lipopolysaccharide export system permease protein LptG [Serratia symbiotica]
MSSWIFGVLDRYIGKTILNTIIITLFMLVALSGIIKFVDQLRRVGQGHYTALSSGVFTILSVPKDVEIFFPMAVLLGTLLGLGRLATCSELLVMQASGFTHMRIACSVMKTAIPLILLTMVIGEWVAPYADQIAHDFRAKKMYGGSLLSIKNGLWAKDGTDFIYIERVSSEKALEGVNIYHFNDQNRLETVRYAATASFNNGIWKLAQVHTSDLTNEKQVTSTQISAAEWKANLTPEQLGVVALEPTSLSIRGLHNYVEYLEQSGQETNRYQLKMWNKVFSPLSVVIMMLMALSFIFGPLRSVQMGIRVVTGISFGFLFYVLDQILGKLSLVYNMPPVLGALLPSMLFLLISMYMLLKYK